MPTSLNDAIVLAATGSFIPNHCISNAELVESFNHYVERYNASNPAEPLKPSSAAFIEKASSIVTRYVLDKDNILNPEVMQPRNLLRPIEHLSLQAEMAKQAAETALAKVGVSAESIDLVIVSCSNFERPYPALSIEVQAALGCQGHAYDMNVACASATFGIQAAYAAIATGQAHRALVLSPEICTAHVDFRNRDSHFIFGDAASAVLLARASDIPVGFRIHDIVLKTQYSRNIYNQQGFLSDTIAPRPSFSELCFHQEGRKVFREVTPFVAEAIRQQIDSKAGNRPIKRLWLHQANGHMNQLIAHKILGRDASEAELPLVLQKYGNTSSAGVILALDAHSDDCVSGDYGILASFGAGYSLGSLVIEKL